MTSGFVLAEELRLDFDERLDPCDPRLLLRLLAAFDEEDVDAADPRLDACSASTITGCKCSGKSLSLTKRRRWLISNLV